jgi:molybdopterin-guanine dinucleotide biosynthesis protein A
MERGGAQSGTGAAAVVLAGGRSSRMGRPKALLPFGGETLIERILRRLRPLVIESVVVAAPGQELPSLQGRIVRDRTPHLGPVAGLAAGLAAISAPRAFVTSCDAPFLDPALIGWMLSEAEGWDVLVPEWEGRLHPLHAVYAAPLGRRYQELLDVGGRRPIELYPAVRVRVVHPEEVKRFDPRGRTFLNLNSPEEYEDALAACAAEER